jgi:anaerobic carbon-monoxide dehydrogenase iron sulfur subunit
VIKYLATKDEKCVGCMTCASVCSRLYFKEDNPAKSRIQVNDLSRGAFHLVACDQECMACVRECPTKAISRGSAGAITIDQKKCIGCLACVAACPIGAMRWFPGLKTPFKCIACGACAKECPKQALEIIKKEEKPATEVRR